MLNATIPHKFLHPIYFKNAYNDGSGFVAIASLSKYPLYVVSGDKLSL